MLTVSRSCSNHSIPVSLQATTTSVMFLHLVTRSSSSSGHRFLSLTGTNHMF